MKNIAVWQGERDQIKADEAKLKGRFAGLRTNLRYSCAGEEVFFIPAAQAIDEISRELGRRPSGQPFNFAERPDYDNLRDPPTHLLDRPTHSRYRQTAWIYREQSGPGDEPLRLKVSRIGDAKTPAERRKRYSLAGLETLAGWSYNGPVGTPGNLRVEAAVELVRTKLGDPGSARKHGWLRAGVSVQDVEEIFHDKLDERFLPGEIPHGALTSYNAKRV